MRRSVPLPTIPQPVSPPLVRVVIRAKNEAAKIGITLSRLGRQTIANEAGAFRADLWRERPFREDMPGTEDKEWAWHWLERGHVVVVDPSFATEHSHRDEGPLAVYRRSRDVWRGFAMYLDLDPYRVRD